MILFHWYFYFALTGGDGDGNSGYDGVEWNSSISISRFMWGDALLSMDRDPARFGAFRNALTAQVFDSPPDYGRIAGGVARSMGYGGMRETAIKSVM